ncbi:MAG: DoxX family protein [Actinomycetota bacterium]
MEANAPVLAIALILFQIADGIACLGPIAPIQRALDTVHCPPSIRRLLPPIKFVSAITLTVGLWIPWIGVLTCGALFAYFVAAIGFHLSVRDTFANTIGAVIMLGFVLTVGLASYISAG